MPQPLSKSAMLVYGLICAAMGLLATWGIFHMLGGELSATWIAVMCASSIGGFILGAALEVRAHGNAVRSFAGGPAEVGPLDIVNTTDGTDYAFTIQATIRPGRLFKGEPFLADHERLLIWESPFIKATPDELSEALDFTVDGMPSLRYVGPVDHFGQSVTMMAEVEPLGIASSQALSLPLSQDAAVRLARGLVEVLSAAGSTGHPMGIVHPNLVYVSDGGDGPQFMGVTSRFNRFYQFEETSVVTDDRPPIFDELPFISPELANGVEPTSASDVFVAGGFLQWLQTGEMPFEDDDRAGYLKAVIAGERREYTGPTNELIGKCCAPTPADRISIQDLQEALMELG